MAAHTSLTIEYQGEKGAYSDRTIDVLYNGQEVNKVPFPTSYEVVNALKKKKTYLGLVVIENSIVGNITYIYDLLLENKLTVLREVVIPIHYALIAHSGADLDSVYQPVDSFFYRWQR